MDLDSIRALPGVFTDNFIFPLILPRSRPADSKGRLLIGTRFGDSQSAQQRSFFSLLYKVLPRLGLIDMLLAIFSVEMRPKSGCLYGARLSGRGRITKRNREF